MKIHTWQNKSSSFSILESKAAKKIALRFIKRGNKILDIGCGDCDFFDLIKQYKKDCYLHAFDVLKEARNIAKNKGYVAHESLNIKQKFDVITAFECLEHLDVVGRVKYSRLIDNMLKIDGYVVMSFPHINSLLAVLNYYDNIEHKPPYIKEKHILSLFPNFKIVKKRFVNPWLNPIKQLHCLLTGLSFNSIFNNVVYV